MSEHLRVAIAFEGYGWHPEAWRHTPDLPSIFSGDYWAGLVGEAERGLVDFVTFDDGLTPQRRRRPEIEPRWLVGRPDALLVAARVAPTTSHVGLIPVAGVTHSTPANLATAIAALDSASRGRAGWQPRVNGTGPEGELYGRRPADDLFAQATDAVDLVRRARAQPVVAVLAHQRRVYEFAARSADLVFITPHDDDQLVVILGEVDDVGGAGLKVYADVLVAASGVVDERSDAHVFDGTARELVNMMVRWQDLGIDGVRLRPAVNAIDLPFIVDEVLPALRAADGRRSGYAGGETLRQRLGLPVAENDHAREMQP